MKSWQLSLVGSAGSLSSTLQEFQDSGTIFGAKKFSNKTLNKYSMEC